MKTTAILVKKLSKKYRLFDSPKERLKEALHPFKKKYHREFWALQDVSFEVPTGSTVGIVGRNGSGKSTLLQIICSVLQSTTGEIKVSGRISALLELGSGFNPEFTGRENVLLNGVLNGIKADEMEGRLPLVEAFAEVGEFINQPVKLYSSGMYLRLAFSSAIHVDPDVLVIDEALAVGDVRFQRKCYQKFHEFQESGKTIIFVTHDVDAIVKHCQSAILLERGSILKAGKPNDVINCYQALMAEGSFVEETEGPHESSSSTQVSKMVSPNPVPVGTQQELSDFIASDSDRDHCSSRPHYNKNEHRSGDERGRIVDYLLCSNGKYFPDSVNSGEWLDIYVKAKFYEEIQFPNYGFKIKTIGGVVIFATNALFKNYDPQPVIKGETVIYKYSIKIDLAAGHYFINLGITEEIPNNALVPLDRRFDILHLPVHGGDRFDGIVNLESTICERPVQIGGM